MKKWLIFALMVPFIALLFSFSVKADSVTDVYVHYYRYQGDYTDWNLWVWKEKPVPQDGTRYAFETDDTATSFNYGGTVVKISLTDDLEGTTQLGIIVHRGAWLEKDIDNNRYVDIPENHTSSELHIYLVEGC